MKTNIIVIFLITAILQSCAVKQQQSSVHLNGYWNLKNINSASINTADKTPGLEFRSAESKVFGFGGCNQFSGSAEVKAGRIKFGALISTKMACPALETETNFLRIISNNEMDFRISGSELTLYSGQDTLIFKKAG